MSTDCDLAKCFEVAKKLTLEAGKIFKCKFEDELVLQMKRELDWDFATEYDKKIEKVLIDGLSKEFPDHKIIGEEMTSDKGEMPELSDEPTWFLDPIDGTANFVHSYPQACISIGLTVRKEPVLGIIYNPSYSELYSAIKGEELKHSLLVTEPTVILRYYENHKDKDIQANRMETFVKIAQCTRCIGSAALTMAYIARGVVDCYQLDGLQPWDIMAGLVILSEAGGIIMETKGGSCNIMKPNIIAASNKVLAQEICTLIVDIDLKTQRKRLKKT